MREEKGIQDGIFYDSKPFQAKHSFGSNGNSNNCFAILFLNVARNSAFEVRKCLEGLWKMYNKLKMGYSYELENCAFPPGGLTVLISYGQNIFELSGITKKIPVDFKDKQFLPGKPGKPILPGCGINYSNAKYHNVGLSEAIALQFISESQLGTYRAIVETKKYLHKNKKQPLEFSEFYTGFQRDDGRSWLGFHDQVSNLETAKDRLDAIAINTINNKLSPRDYWTRNGTYLVYLRLEIDLDRWNIIDRRNQELIIGRDKLSGAPIIGVDKKGDPVTNSGCPSAYEVHGFDAGFHEHPDYLEPPKLPKCTKSTTLDNQASAEILNESHIGRARHIDNINSKYRVSRRIFRQGFEFLEPVYNHRLIKLRLGQNFISFQNDPSRLFFILTHPDWMGNTNFGGSSKNKKMKLLSALAAGVFFVPPIESPFPGISLFKQS